MLKKSAWWSLLLLIGCTAIHTGSDANNLSQIEQAGEFYKSRIANLQGVAGYAIDSSDGAAIMKIFLNWESVEALESIPDSLGSVKIIRIVSPHNRLPQSGE